MRKAYKITCLLLAIVFYNTTLIAQQTPIAPKPPLAPKEPKRVAFDEKKWEEWGKKVEKSFDNFGDQFECLEIASADVDKVIKSINIKLKNIVIPEIPALPELPKVCVQINPQTDVNQNWQPGAPEGALLKIKKISKTFSSNTNDVLYIENSYGKIEINTWNKNEIKVDVEVKAYAETSDEAEKLLDDVSINAAKTANQVVFKTLIATKNKSNNWLTMSFWGGGNNEKEKVEISYTVFMPSKTALNLKTNYNNVVLPNLQGDINLSMNYGDLTAGYLNSKTNIRSNYTQLKLNGCNDALINANYGAIKIGQTKNINANLNYCSVDLGKLSGNATLKMNYSSGFRISSFDQNFESLNINANYSSINLNFNSNTAFNFDVSTTYSSFKYNNELVTITSKKPVDDENRFSSQKNYKGFYGKSPSGNIIIRSNYGGITFN